MYIYFQQELSQASWVLILHYLAQSTKALDKEATVSTSQFVNECSMTNIMLLEFHFLMIQSMFFRFPIRCISSNHSILFHFGQAQVETIRSILEWGSASLLTSCDSKSFFALLSKSPLTLDKIRNPRGVLLGFLLAFRALCVLKMLPNIYRRSCQETSNQLLSNR